MNALQLAQNRYTCKVYDKNFQLDKVVLDRLLESLRLAPSSINIQPWHFFVATNTDSKQRLASFAHGNHAYNQPKINDAAAVIVFAAKNSLTHTHVKTVMDTEFLAGRFDNEQAKETRTAFIQNYLDSQPIDKINIWLENQVYLAVGTFIVLAQVEGLDATPIEGFDKAMCDNELNLSDQGYHSLVMVALGRHSRDDFNAQLPKARFDSASVITFL